MQDTELTLFGNIPETDYLQFRKETGLDYREVADFLDLDKQAISKIANVAKSSVRFGTKMPKEVKEHLEQISYICQMVAESFEGDVDKTALWFKIPNPLLGMISPRDMIRFGRYRKLMQFVIDAKLAATKSGKEQKEAA